MTPSEAVVNKDGRKLKKKFMLPLEDNLEHDKDGTDEGSEKGSIFPSNNLSVDKNALEIVQRELADDLTKDSIDEEFANMVQKKRTL